MKGLPRLAAVARGVNAHGLPGSPVHGAEDLEALETIVPRVARPQSLFLHQFKSVSRLSESHEHTSEAVFSGPRKDAHTGHRRGQAQVQRQCGGHVTRPPVPRRALLAIRGPREPAPLRVRGPAGHDALREALRRHTVDLPLAEGEVATATPGRHRSSI